ncbi:hypothetical protein LXT12_25840 [Pelomonas sp. P7]|uniref:Uncharacterized protein n=1 Tax=Pelomonas caseinilytica TaxID=2906763 RepID=A0ABS8XTX4_9BURK|nr:hypothetical protein [Pelomonas sp. P7]MCE4540660.1 hypothetical protein [Pelomonas sp. P7]
MENTLALSLSNSLFGALLVITAIPATAQNTSSIEDMRTRGDWQGLYEVRQEARSFVAKWNSKHGTSFEALEPNLKAGAVACAVPLRAEWTTRLPGTNRSVVSVICDRTVHAGGEKWKIPVAVADKNHRPNSRSNRVNSMASSTHH